MRKSAKNINYGFPQKYLPQRINSVISDMFKVFWLVNLSIDALYFTPLIT